MRLELELGFGFGFGFGLGLAAAAELRKQREEGGVVRRDGARERAGAGAVMRPVGRPAAARVLG